MLGTHVPSEWPTHPHPLHFVFDIASVWHDRQRVRHAVIEVLAPLPMRRPHFAPACLDGRKASLLGAIARLFIWHPSPLTKSCCTVLRALAAECLQSADNFLKVSSARSAWSRPGTSIVTRSPSSPQHRAAPRVKTTSTLPSPSGVTCPAPSSSTRPTSPRRSTATLTGVKLTLFARCSR
eukprot:6946080-Prymnesium_polylepis.1